MTPNGGSPWTAECVAWDERLHIALVDACSVLIEGQCGTLGGLDMQRCQIADAERIGAERIIQEENEKSTSWFSWIFDLFSWIRF
jgi:hypothetical protein